MAKPEVLTFRKAHERLLLHVRNRMRNGELTERSLARRLGLSQSHMNNVLRGRRNLSSNLADSILNFLHYSLPDLYADGVGIEDPDVPLGSYPEIEVLKCGIGPGRIWSIVREHRSRYRAPCTITGVPECVVLARLAPDRRMTLLHGYDSVVIDMSASARLAESPTSVFIVRRGPETLVRWIRGGFGTLYLAHSATLNRPAEWERLPMQEDQRLEIVKGRVLWIGNEMDLQQLEDWNSRDGRKGPVMETSS